MKRRHAITALAAIAAPLTPWAQSKKAPGGAAQPHKQESIGALRIFIPANAGGGWDQTGRTFGAAVQAAGLADEVTYENVGGKAGVIGLAQFVQKYNATPNTLMVGGMVMLGGIALQRPDVDLQRVAPLAQLTSDYMVVAVPSSSPIKNAKALAQRLSDPNFTATVVGGSAGGVDHMLLGMLLRATSARAESFSYLATSSGSDAAKALLEGKAQIGISGFSEFKEHLADGSIRALAISSRTGRDGIPSLREGGIQTDLANWRGLFAPAGLPAPQLAALQGLVDRTAKSAEWQDAVRKNGWVATYRAGSELRTFIDTEQTMARIVVSLLKLHA